MAEYIPTREVTPKTNEVIKYSNFESRQMWGMGEKITTICRYSLVVRRNGNETLLDKGKTSPNKLKHAEIIAMEKMKKTLVRKRSLNASSLIIELIFWINNSPCEECQYQIVREFQQLKKLLPTVKFRFILFFSSFYKKPNRYETCLESLNHFSEILFKNDVQVTMGLILVTWMAPKPKGRIKGIPPRKRQDRTLTLFRNLYKQCKEIVTRYKYKYTIIPSHSILEKEVKNKNFLKKKSSKNPHFSICPSDILDLDELKLILSKYSQYNFFPKIKNIRKQIKNKKS